MSRILTLGEADLNNNLDTMPPSASMNEIANQCRLKAVKRLIVDHVRALEQSVANANLENTASIGPIARRSFVMGPGLFES